MKIVVSGGGTGGHIYPALALIRMIKLKHPETSFLYIGTEKGLESKLVTREGIPFRSVDITGFRRAVSFENVKTIMRFLKGVNECKKMLKEFKPDVVIGTGGYVCGPVVYAAAKMGIPSIIHEQNSVPGLTNKFLSKYVEKIAVCFEEAKEFFPAEKTILTGNPRASEVIEASSTGIMETFDLQSEQKTVLIFGGSRGAKPINDAVTGALTNLASRDYQVLYVTGDVHYEKVSSMLETAGKPANVSIVPFIHNMPEVLASSNLVVSRAGATTLAELTALGIPSILVPSPYVTNNHQEKNARTLTDRGAAILLLEKDLNADTLVGELDSILMNESSLIQMKKEAERLGIRDAADRLYNVMIDLAGGR
ncbi:MULTISPECIES: undecaprenyldiphospho-muramoylpentapeptide beta-N-acetylglucosaminyltransferase [Bacillaceae]|uniref:UDP-N-acetylglucosamine--N-acetylmuramyl-(pentapeptide) pyrophosphoryl-undecaprenol N-acetylglucosamine transferase n=1 Tax=Domibacillus aminovorans TaxID=29332 RepID=A0A177LAF9_9BACI|nr:MULTISPECIES: undecaprenyldiphospho-muramoylpentapeptide beta-N-acetylglucosaminyltransferase [Bacillaceae]OAH53686.1 UDP-N-acetylglucosamine--N-acetylmuramyl-(pentapeptide) pyrophosphoryl-undecaprenol N-acetylglucosamine transferase [Domibacillus aminovorans]OAH62165.1 UDP-N-acetylglucosamine--N-acetylmuramyl-(pentapeptide) pyrophosphoryl-undecaprenol N-acetylglucosamine transferase [Domibacillus aminovorans]